MKSDKRFDQQFKEEILILKEEILRLREQIAMNNKKADHDQIIEMLHKQIGKLKQHNRQLQAHSAKIEEREEETDVETTACMVNQYLTTNEGVRGHVHAVLEQVAVDHGKALSVWSSNPFISTRRVESATVALCF